ncbi:hypothetical protein [Methanosphaera sp.]
MAKLQWYDENILLEHKKYIFEIMDYLKEHPDELNLYGVLLNYKTATFMDYEKLSYTISDFLLKEPYCFYLQDQRIADKNDELIPDSEFPQWFVDKFPQWKDLFFY